MALTSDVGLARYEWREDLLVLEQVEVLIEEDVCEQKNTAVNTCNS